MRKITSEAKKAFEAGRNYKNSNTEISGGSYFLFGNKIAEYSSLFNDGNRDINITTAGWKSATTKERLNALEGVNIIQRAGIWYLNGQEWGGEWVTVKADGTIIR